VNRLISPGAYVLAVILIAGVWLAGSPFIMQTQPAGAEWTSATINSVAAGAVLIVASLAGILIHLGLATRDLVTLSAIQAEVETETSMALTRG
jgi:hypothetical protein